MKIRAQLLRTWVGPLPAVARLPKHYRLEVVSDRTLCERCGGRLRRQRSSIRYPLGLLLGQPRVCYVEKRCARCGQIQRPELYVQWVPPQGNYAFDLIAEVGLACFRRHLQNTEIQEELENRWGLVLPVSTIGELAQTFLDYLAAAHQAHAPQLRKRLEEDGGYCLHVDGTCEPGTEVVFTAIAGNRDWILLGSKMASEDAAQIAQLLRRCVEIFGKPLALVRDLSGTIEAARNEVLPDVLDRICHYHLLKAVGTKLCDKPHAQLTACLRRSKLQPALHSLRLSLVRCSKQKTCLSAEQMEQLLERPQLLASLDAVQLRRALSYLVLRWLEDYRADLQGEYFPFDLPNLAYYRRCFLLEQWLREVTGAADFSPTALKTLKTTAGHLAVVREDADLAAAAQRLEKAAALFEELRGVLRLTSDPGAIPRCRQGQGDGPAVAQHIPKRLKQWTRQLRQRRASEQDPDKLRDLDTVLGYLDKYSSKLVGHVIVVEGRAEPFLVERTNNISEHHFAHTKQGLRRKLGTKKLVRSIQALRPEALLVANLDDPEYLEILCGGKLENLSDALAQSWKAGQAIRTERRKKKSHHPIPIRKKTLRDKQFLPQLKQAVAKLLELFRGKRTQQACQTE